MDEAYGGAADQERLGVTLTLALAMCAISSSDGVMNPDGLLSAWYWRRVENFLRRHQHALVDDLVLVPEYADETRGVCTRPSRWCGRRR